MTRGVAIGWSSIETARRSIQVLAPFLVTWCAKVVSDATGNRAVFTVAALLFSAFALLATARPSVGERVPWLDRWRLVLVLLGLWNLASVYPRVGGDGVEYYITLRSAVVDADLSFENDYAGLGAKSVRTSAGHAITRMPAGAAIVWSLPFLVVHISTIILSALGVHAKPDGFGIAYQSAVTATSFLAAFGGLLLIEAELRRRFGPWVALIATVLLWLATPLAYYMTVTPSMSHACSMAITTTIVAWWLRIREHGSNVAWAAAGLLVGLVGIIRLQDIVLALVPLVDLVISRPGKWRRYLVIFFCGAAVLPLFQVALWSIEYQPGFFEAMLVVGPQKTGFTPQVLDFLFAARHGLFTWTPLFLFAVAGWFVSLKRDQSTLTVSFLVTFIVATLVNSSMSDWWGSDSFGQRRMLCFIPLFGIGLGAILDALRRRPMVLVTLCAAMLVAWNCQFASIFNSQRLGPRNDSVSLDRVAAAQVELLYERIARMREWLPDWVFVLAHDNLNGVWLDEGSRQMGGRVDFGQEPTDLHGVVGFNWLEPTDDDGTVVRRSRNRRSWLHLPVRTVGDFEGTVRARSLMGAAVPLEVELQMNGRQIGAFRPTTDWAEYRFSVPSTSLKSGFNDLVLAYSTVPREAVPGWRGPNSSIAVDWFRFDRVQRPLR